MTKENRALGGVGHADASPDLATPSAPASDRRQSDAHSSADWYRAAVEGLLDAVIEAPLEQSPQVVAKHLVGVLARYLPAWAVGVCVVDPRDQSPVIEMSLPAGMSEPGRDPTRLFPNLRHESIFAIERLPGSTLHIARDDAAVDAEAAEVAMSRRAAALFGNLLCAVFTFHQKGSSEQREIDLRAQLIQAEKLASFGQVVAGVIHELANPLTSIVAYAEYLTKKGRLQNQAREDVQRLERIGEAAERILRFSRDLIAYARPSADSPGPVPIHDVIDQAISFCEHEFTRRDIELVRRFGTGLPAVRGLGSQLTQVFVNLFTNAAHAMEGHGGKLIVDTEHEEAADVVAVRVTDTGIGIPPELMERLFEPFFTTKEKGQGTGLGLFIVSDIVKNHGGKLDAASTPGEGTTFTVRLPLYYREPDSIRRTIPGR